MSASLRSAGILNDQRYSSMQGACYTRHLPWLRSRGMRFNYQYKKSEHVTWHLMVVFKSGTLVGMDFANSSTRCIKRPNFAPCDNDSHDRQNTPTETECYKCCS